MTEVIKVLKVSDGAAVWSPASGQLRDLIATCSDLTCLLFELVGESFLQRKLPHAGLEAEVTRGFLVILNWITYFSNRPRPYTFNVALGPLRLLN